MRLDHLLSRELSLNVDRIWIRRRDCPKRVARTAGTLLSFEGPSPGRPPGSVSRRTLKTAQLAKQKQDDHLLEPALCARSSRSPSRYEGHTVDALASGVDEGRGRLR